MTYTTALKNKGQNSTPLPLFPRDTCIAYIETLHCRLRTVDHTYTKYTPCILQIYRCYPVFIYFRFRLYKSFLCFPNQGCIFSELNEWEGGMGGIQNETWKGKFFFILLILKTQKKNIHFPLKIIYFLWKSFIFHEKKHYFP